MDKTAAPPPPSRLRTRTKDVPPDRKQKVGNPGLLTNALADRLIQIVVTGVPLDVATAYVGIHRETLRQWRRRGEKALEINASRRSPTERRYADFVTKLDAAVSETTVLAQATLRRLIVGPRPTVDKETGESTPTPMSDTEKRIQADMVKFYLKARERKHYGDSIQAEITGANGGPILTSELSGEEAWDAFVAMFGDPTDDD